MCRRIWARDGVLVDPESHNPTVTDNERIILALTAIGKDPANVGGKNLLAALQNRNIMQVTNTSDTDINGLVFGLLALNSGNYTQDSYWLVQAILTQQNEDGSWSSSADTKPVGDVDMTAMALQALAPYYTEGDDTTVNAAVDKALQWLSAKYKGTGYTSAESCAQVVVALSALQLNANSDSSFVKTVDGAPTSVLGDLLRYYLGEGQGFKHAASGKTADQKATEQAPLCHGSLRALLPEDQSPLRYDRRRLRPQLRRLAGSLPGHLHGGRLPPARLHALRRGGGPDASCHGPQFRRVGR